MLARSALLSPYFLGVLVAVAACAFAGSSAARADTPAPSERFVIAPGQESVLRGLTGFGAGKLAGCAADSVLIERVVLKVGFDCGAKRSNLELHHPSARPEAAHKTVKFSIVAGSDGASDALIAAFAARVKTLEAPFRWSELEAPKTTKVEPNTVPPTPPVVPPVAPVMPPPPATPLPPIDATAETIRGLGELAKKRYEEAVIIFQRLADLTPRPPGAVALLLTSLVALLPDDLRLEMLLSRASVAPSDVLAQLLAGVASHYTAHHREGAARDQLMASAKAQLERGKALLPPPFAGADRPPEARAVLDHLAAALAGTLPPDACRAPSAASGRGYPAAVNPPEPGIGSRTFVMVAGGAAVGVVLIALFLRRRARASARPPGDVP